MYDVIEMLTIQHISKHSILDAGKESHNVKRHCWQYCADNIGHLFQTDQKLQKTKNGR